MIIGKDGLIVRAVNKNNVATGAQDFPGSLLDMQFAGPEG